MLQNDESRPEWQVQLERFNLKKEVEYKPRVLIRGSLTLDDIANEVHERIRMMRTDEIRMVLKVAEQIIMNALTDCYSVKGRLGTLSPGVTGMWDTNRIDPEARAKNQAVANYQMGNALKKRFSKPLFHQTKFRRVAWPRIYKCFDNASKTDNKYLTPGNMAHVTGKFLRFEADDDKQGLYLRNAATREQVLFIPAVQLSLPTISGFWFIIPTDLPEGEYELGIINRCTNSSRPVKELRAAWLDYPLRVVR